MVRTTKKDEEGETIRLNPDSLTGIYVTILVEYEYRMNNQNRKMQERENKIVSKVNGLKKYARVTKRVRSFVKPLAETSNLSSDTKTSEDPSEPLLQILLSLSINTIKEFIAGAFLRVMRDESG